MSFQILEKEPSKSSKQWKTVRLEDVVTRIIGGGTPSRENPSFWNGNIPWLTVKDMRSTRPADSMDHISQNAVEKSSTNIIPADTVIIATRIGLGKVIRVPYEAAINQDLKAIIVPSTIEKAFLEYWFLSIASYLESIGSGTTVKGIRLEQLKALDFPLAPLDDQRRIVAEIEKQFTRLEAGVSALKRVQANLKRYRAAVLKAACEGKLVPTEAELHKSGSGVSPLNQSRDGSATLPFETGAQLLARILEERRKNWLESNPQSTIKNRQYREPAAPDTANLPPLPEGWTWASAEQLCSTVASGSTPSADQLFQREGEVPFIKVYNLTFGGPLDFSVKPTFISEIVHGGRLGRSKAYPGDVLTNIVGPPLGKVSIVPDSFPEWNINQAIVVFRTTEAISNRLLAFWLRSESVLARLGGTAKATAGQFNVQVTTCRKLALPLPPLAEQTRIVAEVERRLSVVAELDAVAIANLQRSIKLRQSILQKAFAGQLEF